MRVSDLRPRERASEPSHNVLASTSLPQREFMEATFKTTWEKSIKFNALLARPKRFELLTPRFVVWCSIQLSYGRVLRIARENVPKTSKAAGNAPLAIGFSPHWQVRRAQERQLRPLKPPSLQSQKFVTT